MTNAIRSMMVLAAVATVATAAGFAQSPGEAVYKAKCQACHGAAGMADTAMGRATRALPITDPDVKKHTAAEMVEFTKNGKDKMMSFKDKLTDAEIKDAVAYYRAFEK
jgi:mono/diheme cytochrome c family protein